MEFDSTKVTRRILQELLCTVALLSLAQAQPPLWTCACGSDPPTPHMREARPYANTPPDLRPYANYTTPYNENYTKLVENNGVARDLPTLKAADVDEVHIGFLGPIENQPDGPLGKMMLSGAQLAIEEANSGGGYGGKPFKLMVHNDQAVWGASSNEIVRMAYDEKVWAMLGSISGDSTHIALRATLKAEVPIVNSAATDPTIPETAIPWYLTTIQDDRVQCYTLARRIYSDLKLRRVALLRVDDRYGKFGVAKFKDAARRLGYPVVIEQRYPVGEGDFRADLRRINESNVEAIVVWGDAAQAALIVQQMREAGMKQRVFGSYRVYGPELLQSADAAEGLEVVYPFDPTRDDPLWLGFKKRFEMRFEKSPDAFASLAFDTMNILLRSICQAGLNRGKIRDALTAMEHYQGVTGPMTFDPNCKNIVPMYLASIRNGKASFRRYGMERAYASAGEVVASYTGPALADRGGGPIPIALFGPRADEVAQSVASLLARYQGRYVLVPIPSELSWGKASAALVDAIYDGHALAILATDRNSSHLAEQLAVKAFVPVVALSSDRSLTSMDIPWIFRVPADTAVAEALRHLLDVAQRSGPNRNRLREELAGPSTTGPSGDGAHLQQERDTSTIR